MWKTQLNLFPGNSQKTNEKQQDTIVAKLFGKKTPNFGNRNGNVNTFTFKDFLSEKTFLGFVEYKTRIVNFQRQNGNLE